MAALYTRIEKLDVDISSTGEIIIYIDDGDIYLDKSFTVAQLEEILKVTKAHIAKHAGSK